MKKLIIVLGVVGVSFSAIFVRLASAPSMVLVFYRMLFAALILLPFTAVKHREELRAITRRELFLSLLSGLFLGLHFLCYFSALRDTSIAAAVVLVDTEVLFVAAATPILFRRHISPRGWIGIGLTLLGSVLIACADFGGGSNVLLGDFLALLGAGCMAVYTLIGTFVRKTRSTAVYTTLVYSAGAATVGLILLVRGTPLFGYTPMDYAAGLGMSIFCTLLGHSVFSWGLKYESPSFVSTAKLLEPVFATLLGILLFREIPGPLVAIGGGIVIAGVAWYARNAGNA